eukprot:8727688-Lingulodinium_polyedra.AAC.1
MKDPQIEAFYDNAVTTDACLTVSKGLVRLVRHIGPLKRKHNGLGAGADADGYMIMATLIE